MSRGNPPRPDDPRARQARAGGREVIFEFTKVGAQRRVAAVDTASGAEAIVFGPATASQADLERLALNKLRYVMGQSAPKPAGPKSGPGTLV